MSGTYSSSGKFTFVVQTTGTYDIQVFGAQGGKGANGAAGGKGAEIGGDFVLTAGETLTLVVGGAGTNSASTFNGGGAGGGGGSFVIETFNGTSAVHSVLAIAGGGGGGAYTGSVRTGGGGQTGKSGHGGYGTLGGAGGSLGSGGTGGGGSAAGGGGGGYKGGTPTSGGAHAGYSFATAGGSYAGGSGFNGGSAGGFGGGGGGSANGGGGGGGYSGGGGGSFNSNGYGGGGGGSLNNTSIENSDNIAVAGIRSGNGEVIITRETPVCYLRGTRILTSHGEVPIEELKPGDLVVAGFGRLRPEPEPRPIVWIGRRYINLSSHPRPEVVAPIRILRGAVADDVPHRDLLVSPDHGVLIDGKLICARNLVNGATILQDMRWETVEYFHIELDRHAIILAERLPAESYLDTGNRGFFENSDAPLELHPDSSDGNDNPTREAGSCEPFMWEEAEVRPIWQRLAERAVALGWPMFDRRTTSDSALRVLADGRDCYSVCGNNGRHVFMLPPDVASVRLVSRSAVPTDTKPWLNDQRRLGVCVKRILLREANDQYEVPVDHPALIRGWWGVEYEGMAMQRWTDGDATLSLPAKTAPRLLEIEAGTLAYLADENSGSWVVDDQASRSEAPPQLAIA